MKNGGSRAIAWLPAILAGAGAAMLSSGDSIQRLGYAVGYGLLIPLFVSFVVIFWTFLVSRTQGAALSDAAVGFSNPLFVGALLACVSLWLLGAILAQGHMHDVARCVENALATENRSGVRQVVLNCDRSITEKQMEDVIIGL